jgi:hypothetical protein
MLLDSQMGEIRLVAGVAVTSERTVLRSKVKDHGKEYFIENRKYVDVARDRHGEQEVCDDAINPIHSISVTVNRGGRILYKKEI